jgi:hypothetical protein
MSQDGVPCEFITRDGDRFLFWVKLSVHRVKSAFYAEALGGVIPTEGQVFVFDRASKRLTFSEELTADAQARKTEIGSTKTAEAAYSDLVKFEELSREFRDRVQKTLMRRERA